MPQLLVQTGTPFFTSESALKDLADRIRRMETGYDVQYAIFEGGGGAQIPADELAEAVEVIRLWLPEAWETVGKVLVGAIVKEAVSWARYRLQQDNEDETKEQSRARIVEIVGPDGKVLKTVKVTDTEDEPADITDQVPKFPRSRPTIVSYPPSFLPPDTQ